MRRRKNDPLTGVIIEVLGNDHRTGARVTPSTVKITERTRRRRRLRRAVALRLRSFADRLEPEHEITVYVRPVIVDQDHVSQTVQMLTEIERRKLGLYEPPSIRPHWMLDR